MRLLKESKKSWWRLCRNGKINIVPAAKYLGFYLGPSVTATLCHEAPFNKYGERSRMIGSAAHASVPATVAYNRDAITVTSYVTQLVAPPKHFCDLQYRLLASVLKIPFRALGNHAVFGISDQWGLPAPFDLFTLSDAIAIRAAAKTVTEWRQARSTMQDAFDRFAGVHQLPESFDNTTGLHRTDAWLSPPHWCMQPMATRLNIAAELDLPVLKGRLSTIRKISSVLDETRKPQKQIYNILRPLFNPESPNDMIRRIGIKHLFSDKLLLEHPNWESRILKALDEIALIAKRSRNRYSSMQVLRFLRNAFISPSRMHSADRCHFCFEQGTSSNISHVFDCPNFVFLCRKSMPLHVAEQINEWIPEKNHNLLLRLLLGLPKMTRSHKSLTFDVFANAAHLFNAGNHNPHLSLSDILRTAEAYFRWPSFPILGRKKRPTREKTSA